MKYIYIILAVIAFANYTGYAAARPATLPPKDYRDFYGAAWRGDVESNLRFAKQMGYDFVMYQRGMENNPLAADLGFYLDTPQYRRLPGAAQH